MKRPAVTGLKRVLRRMKTGDLVIVDGYNGQVILNPTAETLEHFSVNSNGFGEPEKSKGPAADAPVKTLDGREVKIYANSDAPAAFMRAKEMGAQGIGLFRSEFLFNRYRGFPSENEQVDAYARIADAAGEGGVKVRTFDLGADQLVDQNAAREKNPALGLRAIRLGMGYKGLLRTQLRALLRASHGRRIDITLPMVSGMSEIAAVKRILLHEAGQLARKGTKIGKPQLGVMIEVPSAVVMIDEIVDECDFVCLGTNDLIQYLLAADRDNEAVSGWYRTLHPAVLRSIRRVLFAAERAGKPAIVCGEMAGSPFYVPLLIGLGATELSMNATSIRRIKRIVSGIAFEEAFRLVESVKDLRTAEDVEFRTTRQVRKSWAHLFPDGFSFS